MPQHTLTVPHDILNGLFFPNVTSIKLMQRSTGEVRVISRIDLKAKLSTKRFDEIFNDIDISGEYMDDDYHAIAYEQDTI